MTPTILTLVYIHFPVMKKNLFIYITIKEEKKKKKKFMQKACHLQYCLEEFLCVWYYVIWFFSKVFFP
jgi:hypothetical protein